LCKTGGWLFNPEINGDPMKISAICFLVIALAVISVANAQNPKLQPPTQPPVDKFLKDLDASVPVKMKATEIAVAAQVSALARPETAEKMARYVKNFQNALIKEGFTKEEALRIVTSMPLPANSN
jgi:hypothetical protein